MGWYIAGCLISSFFYKLGIKEAENLNNKRFALFKIIIHKAHNNYIQSASFQ